MAAPTVPTQQSNKLILKGNVYSVDKERIKGSPDFTFKDKKNSRSVHKTVLTQASPFFKEQWQQDKTSAEYPQPGDIDWKVFTNTISILYGEEVEFEEEALLDLYSAADYLQLDALKIAIVMSLVEEWEVKNPKVEAATLTMLASQADRKIHGLVLATMSVRYLIMNIPTIACKPDDAIDISALSYDTVKEIAQSEKVTASEIDLYHFVKRWADCKANDLTVQQNTDLFSHIRYGTIPHDDLKSILKNSSNDTERLSSAFQTLANFETLNKADIKQLTTRKRQQPVPLLNTPDQKKWTKRACLKKDESSPQTNYCYSIVNRKENDGLVLSLLPTSVTYRKCSLKVEYASIICTISALASPQSRSFPLELKVGFVINGEDAATALQRIGYSTAYNSIQVKPSSDTVIIRTTHSGIEVKALSGPREPIKTDFNYPHPWLLTIECNIPFSVEAL